MESPFVNLDGSAVKFDEIQYCHLSQLTNFEEGYKIEAKSVYDTAVQKKLPKSICSFANCSGGWLFIGVANGTMDLVDVIMPNGEIELNIINSIKRFVDVEIPNLIRARFIENPNKKGYGVIVIGINEGLHPPYIANGAIYVRSGAQSEPVPAERATIDYLYKKSDRSSILLLKGLNNTKVLSTFEIRFVSEHLQFENKIEDLQKKIYEIIKRNDFVLPTSAIADQQVSSTTTNPAINMAVAMLNFNRGKEQNAKEFLEREIALITEFIQVYSIECNLSNLFSFGDLKIYYNSLTHSTTIDGTDMEKTRYQNIVAAHDMIEELCSLLPLSNVSQYVYRIDLAIANEGNYYDEDIVLSLQIPKNSFLNFAELKLFSNANDFNKILLKTTARLSIPAVDDYDNYGFYKPVLPPMETNGLFGLIENKEEKLKQECESELEHSYSPFVVVNYNSEYDILKIKFDKLNPNQIKSLPAPLFFNCELTELHYSIVSKYSTKKSILTIKKSNTTSLK